MSAATEALQFAQPLVWDLPAASAVRNDAAVAGLVATEVSLTLGATRVLDRVSLSVEPGTVHAILGPNGAGKSTLLSLLSGERAPDRGEVALSGRPLSEHAPRALARLRGVLPQETPVAFPLTAWEVVRLGRSPHATSPETDAAIVRDCLQRMDVETFAGRLFPTLSGGERQRVHLARVLAQLHGTGWTTPGYLLLDEPTSALDLQHQWRLVDFLRHYARDGRGVAVVLHDLALAAACADVVTVIDAGRVVAQGAPVATLTTALLAEIWGVRGEWLTAGSASERGARLFVDGVVVDGVVRDREASIPAWMPDEMVRGRTNATP